MSDRPGQSSDEILSPPQKRPRIEPTETITIARESFTLTRPSRRGVLATPRDRPITRRHVDRYLKLQYNESDRSLVVSSRPKSPYGTFRSELSLGRPRFTEAIMVALNVASRSRDLEDEDGGLWVAVDVSFERKDEKECIRFSLSMQWNTSTYTLRDSWQRKLSQQVLDTFLPRDGDHSAENEKVSPRNFYEASFMPDSTGSDSSSLNISGLTTRLYPFQRRALQWLLNREGVSLSQSRPGEEPVLEPLSTSLPVDEALSFRPSSDADGNRIFVSDLYHVVLRDVGPMSERERGLRGGILAEEMGLGKTVEVISLVLTHKRPQTHSPILDHTAKELRPTPATLIVTPLTLSKQWISEFQKHAPSLRVMVYDGVKGYNGHENELIEKMANNDVVITTYNVLQAEIHFAEPPPQRNMRKERKYHRPRSPLVQLSWWRVCLDEAQQIESGVSNAAKVARLIPRVNAWGVTGTPVKEDIKDLWGLLRELFLGFPTFFTHTPILLQFRCGSIGGHSGPIVAD